MLPVDGIRGEQVGRVEDNHDVVGVVTEVLHQPKGRVGVAHDVALFGFDSELHSGRGRGRHEPVQCFQEVLPGRR